MKALASESRPGPTRSPPRRTTPSRSPSTERSAGRAAWSPRSRPARRCWSPASSCSPTSKLTGGAREKVDARLVLWLKAHVRKLLGPLFPLTKASGWKAWPAAFAYQVAENLGVLDRTVVQGELKTLPQDARAALRKLGVRFGAYHITVPALQKPAPPRARRAALAAQARRRGSRRASTTSCICRPAGAPRSPSMGRSESALPRGGLPRGRPAGDPRGYPRALG